jgi:hypothetical protein
MRPYVDDLENVPPDAELVRRVNRAFIDWQPAVGSGRPRISRQAFQTLDAETAATYGCPGPGMSFDVAAKSDLITLPSRYPGDGLVLVTAELIRRSSGWGIDFRPTDENPAHAVAFRFDGGRKVPNALGGALATMASERIIVLP